MFMATNCKVNDNCQRTIESQKLVDRYCITFNIYLVYIIETSIVTFFIYIFLPVGIWKATTPSFFESCL